MGLSAALGALERGHDVTVVEADQVGSSLRRWGPTRFFTPLGMNVAPSLLARIRGAPPPESLLTGPEMTERVLQPLAALLDGRVHTNHRVLGIGRARMMRSELVGHPIRGERAFRLLVESADGEKILEADRVLDASGVYGLPNPVGAGGVPAPGERAAAGRILRHLGELHRRRAELTGKRVLVVGNGHSAANALGVLDELACAGLVGQVVWAVRSPNARPCFEVAGDPLPERQSVVARANGLAERPPAYLTVERRTHVEAIEGASANGPMVIRFSGGRTVEVDLVLGLTGYRPDLSILSELSIEIGPRTEGAARLERAVSAINDCLSVPNVDERDLGSDEQGFFLVGAKSYGRARTFLLQTGQQQLETVLSLL
jgi:hypothetical protein